jgi:hypothetical protein
VLGAGGVACEGERELAWEAERACCWTSPDAMSTSIPLVAGETGGDGTGTIGSVRLVGSVRKKVSLRCVAGLRCRLSLSWICERVRGAAIGRARGTWDGGDGGHAWAL